MAEPLSSVYAVCKMAIPKNKPKYRLQRELSQGDSPTELCHQLRGVVGAELSACLGSHFLCLSHWGKLLMLANQKKCYKESRSELLNKLHDASAPSLMKCLQTEKTATITARAAMKPSMFN